MHILFIDLDEGLVKPQFLEHFLMFLFEWCTSFSCKIDIMYSHVTKHVTFDGSNVSSSKLKLRFDAMLKLELIIG